MTARSQNARAWPRSPWRKALWLAGAALLGLPALAMQFTDEVRWDEADFLVMGLLIAAACAAVDAGMRLSGALAYRAGLLVAVGGAFLLVWVNLAVGAIGSEDDPAKLMYAGVLVTGMVGAALSRLRARGMATTMLAMAAVQVAVAGVALALGMAPPEAIAEIAGVTLFFLGPWLLSAALFAMARGDSA